MRKALIVLTLTAALAAGRPAALSQVWTLLTSIWSEAGCEMDPSGQCAPTPQTDSGCGMDPNGCPKGS
jgi:hypothetical protein